MRSYASCETNKGENYPQLLPKLKISSYQSRTNQSANPSAYIHKNVVSSQSDIKGIVGQAISFYSNNNLGPKHKPRHVFETSVKEIININFSSKSKNSDQFKQRQRQKQKQREKQREDIYMGSNRQMVGRTDAYNHEISQICQSYRKNRYYAFERLVKMNSESYGAYKNWLMQKRKISPLISSSIKKNKTTCIKQPNVKNTLNNCQSNQQIDVFLNSHSQILQNEQRTLERILRNDLKPTTKQKSKFIINKKQTLQQLYVTRTNLIKKLNLTSQQHSMNGKKQANIKYSFPKNKQYKFYLGPGNNHQIIKKVLKETRGSNWTQTTQYDTLFNLKWEQYTDKSAYNKLQFTRYRQLINHLQFHEHITTKAGLIQTLKYLQVRSSHTFDINQIVPITFVFDWSDKFKFQDQLKKFVFYYCQNHPDVEHSLKMQRDFVDVIRSLWKGQKNPPNMSFDKNSFKKLNIPPLPPVFKTQQSNYLWIIKPSDYNRGRGIKIFSTLQQMCQIIKQQLPTDTFVIQKYIQSPMLLRQRKFDIRVWVLVSPQGEAFFFSQGYIRTSCQQFTLNDNNKNNKYIHLTNNAVQKNSQKYGKYQQGNQLNFDDVDRVLNKLKWLPQIMRICCLVMEAGIGKITGQQKIKHNLNSSFIKQTYRLKVKNNQSSTQCAPIKSQYTSMTNSIRNNQSKGNCKKSTFQLFGFDFMIDSEQKVWLIQVNTNPCLQTSSKILQILIPRMIDDTFKIVLDPIFKTSIKLDKTLYEVQGYDNHENMWIPLFKN